MLPIFRRQTWRAKCQSLKSWQWFVLLYLLGFVSLVGMSYLLKLGFKVLP